MSRRLGLLAAAALALTLCACSQPVSWSDQPDASASDPIALAPGSTVGQTFVALESGLTAVDVYLSAQQPATGTVQLVLQPAPQTPGAGATLATASLPASSVQSPGFYHFAFTPQPSSRLHSYYLRLQYAGPGQLLVGHAAAEAYFQGALYRNDGPDDGAQLAFRLGYDPLLVAAGLAQQALTWLSWLLAAGLLFVLPGWALLVWLWPAPDTLTWGEHLGLAIGLSLAIYPILFLATSLVGLSLGWLMAVLPVGAGMLALAAWVARRWRRGRLPLAAPYQGRSDRLADLAFVGVAGLIFFTRFWAARSVLAPLWGDSYQHTLITQLLIDHGGLFNSWSPYADLQTFTYHFGFHAAAAVFHWLTGLSAPEAVLWVGQILNGLAVL